MKESKRETRLGVTGGGKRTHRKHRELSKYARVGYGKEEHRFSVL